MQVLRLEEEVTSQRSQLEVSIAKEVQAREMEVALRRSLEQVSHYCSTRSHRQGRATLRSYPHDGNTRPIPTYF